MFLSVNVEVVMAKKILLTNQFIENFTGSELNLFDIAKQFKELEYEVVVATFSYKFPLKSWFENYNIKVIDLLNEKLDIKDFDLIWAQHSPVLEYCLFIENITAKKIIFLLFILL
jgi:hypothetical protein